MRISAALLAIYEIEAPVRDLPHFQVCRHGLPKDAELSPMLRLPEIV
jgi:hypothetical protein